MNNMKPIQVKVSIYNISAERFQNFDKPFLKTQITTNLNIIDAKKHGDRVEVPFVFTVNYAPSLAQLSMKGKAYILGEKNEMEKIQENYRKNHVLPSVVAQSISNVVFLESINIARTLNIPPPIPLPKVSQSKVKERKTTAYI